MPTVSIDQLVVPITYTHPSHNGRLTSHILRSVFLFNLGVFVFTALLLLWYVLLSLDVLGPCNASVFSFHGVVVPAMCCKSSGRRVPHPRVRKVLGFVWKVPRHLA